MHQIIYISIKLNLLWFRVFIRETAYDTMAIKLEAEGTVLDKKRQSIIVKDSGFST